LPQLPQTVHMSKRAKVWAIALGCLVVIQIGASLFLARSFRLTAISDFIQLALLLSAAASCVPSVLKNSGRTRLFWALMALGLTSWSIYQVFWTYFEVVKRQDVPNLFTSDVILFLHIVPMMAALALQPNVEQHDRDLRLGSLDFALLLLWWVYLYLYAVIPWQYVYASESAYALNLKVSYFAEQLAFLVALVFLWSRSTGLWKTIYAHWFGASLLYSLGSWLANSAIAGDTYYSGSMYDLPLVVAIAWMAVPGLLALKILPEQAKSAPSLARGVWAARLGMLAVFSLPVFAWLSLFNQVVPAPVRTFRLALTLSAMVLMGAMVFLKQHFLDIELIRLLRSSRQSFEELQLLQGQLVQSEKLASLGQLVGGAAHELNNPLTAMLGYSELLSHTQLSPEQRALSEKISTQTKRVRTLVASLLSFAKQGPSAKSSLDLNSILKTAVNLCQPQMVAAQIKCLSEMAEPLPPVKGDLNQLLQVFSHIINNAVNAMAGRGGTLTVSTRTERNVVVVQFSDTGPGMLEPDRVFDPFYTTRPVGQGTGLGLSACYGIIEEHAGKITCHNEERGGAVFTIELPALEQMKSPEHAHAHSAK
jgi:signal transduction histidine kinase